MVKYGSFYYKNGNYVSFFKATFNVSMKDDTSYITFRSIN